MLEDFLKDIYDNALTLELLKEASYYSGIRQPYKCREIWNLASKPLNKMVDTIKIEDEELYNGLIDSICRAKECFFDRSKFSSIIDNDIIPMVSEFLKKSAEIYVDAGSWTLFSSMTGVLNMKDKNGLYLHSYSDPLWEGFIYAQNLYDPYVSKYKILGCGLGYLAYQLWRLSECEAEIYVYEIDKTVRDYSYLYGMMSFLEEDHINVICDDDKDFVIEQFFEEIPDSKQISTIYYFDDNSYSGPYSKYIKSFRSIDFTSRVFDSKWKRNYSFNICLQHSMVSQFDVQNTKDEWIVVAAGPSLNDNEDFLIDSVGRRTICTVNTSLKWFYTHNILPDICFACDPNNSLIPYIEDIQEFSRNIPIIADYVTNHKYLELYKGSRYYAVTDASSSIIDFDIDDNSVWSFGGTVTSMALEAAFRMGAKRVYLVGADLSYPERQTYAEGVGAKVDRWNFDEINVVSVDDKFVPTSRVFSEYILQIEDQILENSNCEVINRSLHGAYIKGTYCGMWWENLPTTELPEDYYRYIERLDNDSLILGWSEKYYIFWQAICSMEAKKLFPNIYDNQVISDIYTGIFDAFCNELNMDIPSDISTDEALTYIFTNEFWNKDEEHTQNVLKIANAEIQNSRKVLIINSSEKLGGRTVPIHNAIPVQYNSDLETTNFVNCGKLKIPYFQFGIGMPEINLCRVFVDSMSRVKPSKMYITSPYSLLGDYCAMKYNISVEKTFI